MDQIFDPIRKKFVKLTPEEQVRQHVIKVLTRCWGYPETHLAVEYGFKYNKRQYRADIRSVGVIDGIHQENHRQNHETIFRFPGVSTD